MWSRIINRHFSDVKHRLSKKIRNTIVHQIENWDLLQKNNELKLLRSINRRFDLLKCFNNEWKCTYDIEHCHYIYRKINDIRCHLWKVYEISRYHAKKRPSAKQQKRREKLSDPWEKIVCQRFSINKKKSLYFEVQSSKEHSRTADRMISIWDQIIFQLNQQREKTKNSNIRIIERNDIHDIDS